jgi:hypothetical protein
VVHYLDWLLDLGFASRIILFVKVKVLGVALAPLASLGVGLDEGVKDQVTTP